MNIRSQCDNQIGQIMQIACKLLQMLAARRKDTIKGNKHWISSRYSLNCDIIYLMLNISKSLQYEDHANINVLQQYK